MCVVEIICTYIYILFLYIYNVQYYTKYGFCGYSYRFINLVKLLLYFTVITNPVNHTITYLFNFTK